MSNTHLPDNDHIVRYCFKDNGGSSITGAHFQARKRDNGSLSVNWLECMSQEQRASQIQTVKDFYRSKFSSPKSEDKIAVLNVKETIDYVHHNDPNNKIIKIIHRKTKNDPCHCGVEDLALDDDLIFELLAQTVKEQYEMGE